MKELTEVQKLIDLAGTLYNRIKLQKAEYEDLRGRIANLLPEMREDIPVQDSGDFYQAMLMVEIKKTVDIEKLQDERPQTFWALVKVPVEKLTKRLGPEEALRYITEESADTPTLRITKI